MKKAILVIFSAFILSGCGLQSIPEAKNVTESALAEINNQYKRRADLIPNLVNVVKGYAKHESSTLEAVVSARARATQITVDPSRVTPQQLAEFQAAQGQLSQALGRLMMITENYPNLKADANFRDLQAQIEGTENRIAVARNRYIQAVERFNNLVTVPPTSWTNALFYKHEKMAQWDVSTPEEKQQIEKAPEVNL